MFHLSYLFCRIRRTAPALGPRSWPGHHWRVTSGGPPVPARTPATSLSQTLTSATLFVRRIAKHWPWRGLSARARSFSSRPAGSYVRFLRKEPTSGRRPSSACRLSQFT